METQYEISFLVSEFELVSIAWTEAHLLDIQKQVISDDSSPTSSLDKHRLDILNNVI